MDKKCKFSDSDKSGECGDKPNRDFVPTRDEVEQARKLVEEVRRSTRDVDSQPRQRDAKVARPFS